MFQLFLAFTACSIKFSTIRRSSTDLTPRGNPAVSKVIKWYYWCCGYRSYIKTEQSVRIKIFSYILNLERMFILDAFSNVYTLVKWMSSNNKTETISSSSMFLYVKQLFITLHLLCRVMNNFYIYYVGRKLQDTKIETSSVWDTSCIKTTY